MKKDIRNYNSKGKFHGYQKLYGTNGKLWLRANYKNNIDIGYQEYNLKHLNGIGDEGTEVCFYII